MDFEHSPRVKQLQKELGDFMQEHVLPNEHLFKQQTALNRWSEPPILKTLKAKAKAQGLWNLFMPGHEHGGQGLSTGTWTLARNDRAHGASRSADR